MNKQLYYLLGYFYADGYLCNNQYLYPTLEIAEHDGNIIEQIIKFTDIKYTTSIRKRKNSKIKQQSFRINANSNHIDLFRNIMKDKVNMTLAFNIIEPKYHFMFMRGFFDGDGCIYLNKNGGSRLYFYGQHNQNWNSFINILNSLSIKYSYQQIARKNRTHLSSHIYIANKPHIDILFNYMYPNKIFDFGLYRKYQKLLQSGNSIKRKYYKYVQQYKTPQKKVYHS